MRITSTRYSLINILIEIVGIKSGLLLREDQLIPILEQTYDTVDEITFVLGGSGKWWQGSPEDFVAVRAEEIEANFILAMYGVGAIPDCRTPYAVLVDFVRQNTSRLGINGSNRRAVYEASQRLLTQIIFEGTAPDGAEELLLEYQRRDILNRSMPIQREWNGIISLGDLFESEDMPPSTAPEHYFDQRYIDYLNAQPQEMQRIHWRQFEYLTAEYFQRCGYLVTVTPPRGDGGVDVIAKRESEIVGPDLIVIQCRRYTGDNAVSLNEVKAFWTTLDEQGATKGLIVTTSRLTSGGHKFVEARKYRLAAVEGDNVRRWIAALSSQAKPA